MRRFMIMLIIFVTIFCAKYFDKGLLEISLDGVYREYQNGEEVLCLDEKPFLRLSSGYSRLDIENSVNTLEQVILDLDATVLWQESVSSQKIYYLYTSKIRKYEIVKDTKVNVMIAVSDSMVVVGSPLILGSY